MKNLINIFCLLAAVGLVIIAGCSSQPKLTKEEATQKLADLKMKYDISNTQWYDIYTQGLIPGTEEAGKLILQAQNAVDSGEMKKAEEFIVQADTLLKTYTMANLPDYSPPTPLANPGDHGKVHKATLQDLRAMEFYGVPRWNYWFNFVGKADDGTLYMAYAYINHHGTGKITPPIVFAMSTSKDPSNILKVKFTEAPTLKDTKDSRIWIVRDGDNTLTYTLTDGKVGIKFESKDLTVDVASVMQYSFWYNKNVNSAEMMPGAPMAGFEETGAAEGYFLLNGQKIMVKGFGESENLFCGGKGVDYRSALIKYGNEWWVPFHTDQAQGLICMTGKYKDAGLFLNGKYVVPSSVEVLPVEANKSFQLKMKTSEGDLDLLITCWGWDPPLYEHWATCEGTFKGQNLTNGYAWLEHIPQGGVNASPPVGGRKGVPEKN